MLDSINQVLGRAVMLVCLTFGRDGYCVSDRTVALDDDELCAVQRTNQNHSLLLASSCYTKISTATATATGLPQASRLTLHTPDGHTHKHTPHLSKVFFVLMSHTIYFLLFFFALTCWCEMKTAVALACGLVMGCVEFGLPPSDAWCHADIIIGGSAGS